MVFENTVRPELFTRGSERSAACQPSLRQPICPLHFAETYLALCAAHIRWLQVPFAGLTHSLARGPAAASARMQH